MQVKGGWGLPSQYYLHNRGGEIRLFPGNSGEIWVFCRGSQAVQMCDLGCDYAETRVPYQSGSGTRECGSVAFPEPVHRSGALAVYIRAWGPDRRGSDCCALSCALAMCAYIREDRSHERVSLVSTSTGGLSHRVPEDSRLPSDLVRIPV